MKGIRIEQGSWHYWLAEAFGWKKYRREEKYSIWEDGKPHYEGEVSIENDFCSYVRRVILGIFCSVMVTLACIMLVAVIMLSEYYALKHYILCTFFKECHDTPWSNAGTVLNIFIVAMYILYLLIDALPKYLRRRAYNYRSGYSLLEAKQERKRLKREAKLLRKLQRQNRETFLKMAYRSIKDRVCYRVDIQ